MSIDLQVWAAKPVQLSCFRDQTKWQSEHTAWKHLRGNWQILVSASRRAQAGDVPRDINRVLPGILWETDLNFEGKQSPRSVRLLHAIADDLARSTQGVVFDPQDDSIRLPSGAEGQIFPKQNAAPDVISMLWWFLDSPIESHQGRVAFFELLERQMPECLPKRYGLFEPPQYVYDQTGNEHFLQFLEDNLHDTIAWHPRHPVVGVHLALPLPRGAHKQGFRANHLRIDIEKQAILVPGWAARLTNFWESASVLIRPFYGEVRAHSGSRWTNAPISADQRYSVTSWHWVGIPKRLGVAVVLGDAYQIHWPGFVRSASLMDGLAFASLEDWLSEGDLIEQVGPPPLDRLILLEGSSPGMTEADFVNA